MTQIAPEVYYSYDLALEVSILEIVLNLLFSCNLTFIAKLLLNFSWKTHVRSMR